MKDIKGDTFQVLDNGQHSTMILKKEEIHEGLSNVTRLSQLYQREKESMHNMESC